MGRLFYSGIVLFAFLSLQSASFSQSFTLIKDINVGSLAQCLADIPQPLNLTELGGSLYFTSKYNAPELWKSDGTTAGTIRIKEFPDLRGVTLAEANDVLFITGNSQNTGNQELWKSDGTEAGTVLVYSWANNYGGGDIVSSNGLVYINLGATNALWRSDGTAAGTMMLKSFTTVSSMTDVDGTLFISGDGQLWKSNGTPAGTLFVKSVGIAASPKPVAANGLLIFVGFDNASGYEPWKSDGTEAGTVMLQDVEPGLNGSNIRSFCPSNTNWVYFFATNSFNGEGLWNTNGTAAGTQLVADLDDAGQYSYGSLTDVNGTIFFTGYDAAHGTELWKSNGSVAGTVMVKDIFPGAEINGVGSSRPTSLINLNGTLYFSANNEIFTSEFGATDCATSGELWKSDGTEAGTVLVKDIYQGPGGSAPSGFIQVGNMLFFKANNGLSGRELWKTDGTANGTTAVKDIVVSPGSNPKWFTEMNGKVYFKAFNQDGGPAFSRGTEIYQTNGTVSGTGQTTWIYNFGSNPNEFVNHNGELYISAYNGGGVELYKSNGLGLYSAGAATVVVKKINSPSSPFGPGSNPSHLTSGGQFLFFSVTDGINGYELWKTDGTSVGTALVKDINPTGNSNPDNLINVNGTLFFTADNGTDGIELWKSDGTDAGTVMIKNIHTAGNSNPAALVNVNGTLYFTADDGVNGIQLWKSNGTEAGTILVKNINAIANSNPASLTNINGVLYFSADDGINGVEAWKSDGTEAGTVLLKDIYAGPLGSNPTLFTDLNGIALFAADDGIAGRELWGSNGTDAGTILIKDIQPGSAGSNPSALKKIGDNVLFAANDGIRGNEVWLSNGAESGTRLMSEIEPGVAGSDPTEFFEYGSKVLVAATNAMVGSEVWIADVPEGSPLPLDLLEFKGSVVNDDGVLKWKTDNEPNTSSFIIERSLDGRNYTSIGSVSAANSPGVHYYDFTDVNIVSLGANNIYYRLKQTDIDGRYTYSNIVVLSIDNKKPIVLLYPNPAKDKFNMTFTISQNEKLQWLLTDNTGRTIKRGIYDLSAGSTAVSIDIADLSSGIYLMQLNGSTLQQVFKVIKQ